MAARFYPIARTERLATAIIRLGSERDVYVGCTPRTRRHGGRDPVAHAHVLWADCDTLEASEKLATFQPPPSTVITSGSRHGRHAYWALQRPLAAADIETANTRLAHALGADPACCDPSRILRPPGTHSFKYSPPVPVCVERLKPNRRYSAEDIVGRLPDLPAREAHVTPRETADDGLLSIAPDHYVLALLGAHVPPDRKVSCPFHTDTHASLHVYPTAEAGWFCFSCRRGGSIYDLAAPLWGLDTRGHDFRTLRARLLETMAVACRTSSPPCMPAKSSTDRRQRAISTTMHAVEPAPDWLWSASSAPRSAPATHSSPNTSTSR